MVTIGGATIGPLHVGVLGFLVVMTLTGLYLTNKGQRIPQPIQLGFGFGMVLAFLFALQVVGLIGNPKTDESEENASYFEKKKERKERKLKKKADAEAEKEAEREVEREAKEVAKLARNAEKKVLKQQEAAAKKAEEEQKAIEAAEAAPVEVKKPKKKKKKKHKEHNQAAAAAAAADVAVTASELAETADDQGWVLLPYKTETRAAKKALNPDGPRVKSEMMVNSRHFALIKGAEGKTVAQILEMFGVEVFVPRKGSESQHVGFTGTEAGIESAKAVINELIEKGYSKTLNSDLADVTVDVPNRGLLVGNGGLNIKAIQSKTNTRISLEKNSQVATIVGCGDDVQEAAIAINQLMKDGYSTVTHPNWIKHQVSFPASMVGILKGPGGETIQRIGTQTGARIAVSDAKDTTGALVSISLLGTRESVLDAAREIQAIQTDYICREISFPANLKAALMGPSGKTIRNLQGRTKTRIDVASHLWDPSENVVTVAGYEAGIVEVEQFLAQIVQNHGQWKIDFPAERVGTLFGKKGAAVRQLQDKTGTRIQVNDHEWDDLVKSVSVTGPIDGVSEARSAIEGIAKPAPKKTTTTGTGLTVSSEQTVSAGI